MPHSWRFASRCVGFKIARAKEFTLFADFVPWRGVNWKERDARHASCELTRIMTMANVSTKVTSPLDLLGRDVASDVLAGKPAMQSSTPPASGVRPLAERVGLEPLVDAIKQFERGYLLKALAQCSWQRTRTADMLGISRKTLWQKLKQHRIVESEGA